MNSLRIYRICHAVFDWIAGLEAIRLFKILNRDQRNTFVACFLGWALGASLAMESLPTQTRGLFSGILQQGYAVGYLLAALVYWIVFPHFGWRGLFIAGALPAFLVIYIRARVPESAVWQRDRVQGKPRMKMSIFIKQ